MVEKYQVLYLDIFQPLSVEMLLALNESDISISYLKFNPLPSKLSKTFSNLFLFPVHIQYHLRNEFN